MTTTALVKRRILVVDDEPFICDAVKMMLSFDGHSVQTATNGADALSLFDREKFDLVITDLTMPIMRGDELADAIKARDPKLPVVMITAYAETLRDSAHAPASVDFIVSKPFLLEHLREAIAKTIHAGQL